MYFNMVDYFGMSLKTKSKKETRITTLLMDISGENSYAALKITTKDEEL